MAGDYSKFLGEQYKRSRKCGHHARAVRVMVKRVELKLARGNFDVKAFDGK